MPSANLWYFKLFGLLEFTFWNIKRLRYSVAKIQKHKSSVTNWISSVAAIRGLLGLFTPPPRILGVNTSPRILGVITPEHIFRPWIAGVTPFAASTSNSSSCLDPFPSKKKYIPYWLVCTCVKTTIFMIVKVFAAFCRCLNSQ